MISKYLEHSSVLVRDKGGRKGTMGIRRVLTRYRSYSELWMLLNTRRKTKSYLEGGPSRVSIYPSSPYSHSVAKTERYY